MCTTMQIRRTDARSNTDSCLLTNSMQSGRMSYYKAGTDVADAVLLVSSTERVVGINHGEKSRDGLDTSKLALGETSRLTEAQMPLSQASDLTASFNSISHPPTNFFHHYGKSSQQLERQKQNFLETPKKVFAKEASDSKRTHTDCYSTVSFDYPSMKCHTATVSRTESKDVPAPSSIASSKAEKKKVSFANNDSVKTHVSSKQFEQYRTILLSLALPSDLPAIKAAKFMMTKPSKNDELRLEMVAKMLGVKLGRFPKSNELLEVIENDTIDETEIITSFIEACQTEEGHALLNSWLRGNIPKEQTSVKRTEPVQSKQTENETHRGTSSLHSAQGRSPLSKEKDQERQIPKPNVQHREYTLPKCTVQSYPNEGYDEWW